MMDHAPFREIAPLRQHAPLATALQQVQNSAEHLIQINGARSGFLAGIFQQDSDRLKQFATDSAGLHFSYALIINHPRQILNGFLVSWFRI